MTTSTKKHIVILGAGISGLSLAWFLKNKYHDTIQLTILEKNHRAGGCIQTLQKDGFLFELGPRSCRTKGAGITTLKLVEQLGLQDELIVADAAAKVRYLYMNQTLQTFPHTLYSFLTSPVTKGLPKALFREWRIPASSGNADESIYDFISRRLSPEIAMRLVDPLISGIYAGDVKKLSLKSCFPILARWEKEQGSILKGMWASYRHKKETSGSPFVQTIAKEPIFSFKKGMRVLVDGLTEKLAAHLRLDAKVTCLQFHEKGVDVQLANGEMIVADQVFSTIPTYELATLMPQLEELPTLLKKITSESIAVVSLGYKKSVLTKKGFGYLIPTREEESILGVVWDSSVFPQQNIDPAHTRLSVMIGGSHMSHFDELSEADFLNLAQDALAKHLQIADAPDVTHISIYHKVIPQYHVGHLATVQEIEAMISAKYPQLKCLGNSLYGVSVNDCIAQAERFASGSSIFSPDSA